MNGSRMIPLAGVLALFACCEACSAEWLGGVARIHGVNKVGNARHSCQISLHRKVKFWIFFIRQDLVCIGSSSPQGLGE